MHPGTGLPLAVREQLLETYRGEPQGLQEGGTTKFGIDMLVNFVPRNPVQAAASMDMLGVIVFSLIFGAALTLIPKEKSQPVVRLLDAVGDVIVRIIGMAMQLAPYGVFGLIFVVTSRFGFDILKQLGLYVVVVLLGLLTPRHGSVSALRRLLGGV